MAPTQERKPVRYFYIQLKPDQAGQWPPEVKVHADTVCENVRVDDGEIVHCFKRDTTIVAQYDSDLVAGWRVEE